MTGCYGGGQVELKDPHSVAGILKLYFRELFEPLIPERLYKALVSLNTHSSDEINATVAKVGRRGV